MSVIDRNSPIPIYHQLKTLIQEKIEQGVWQPGDRIPTEQRLCQMFDISRSPVRQALNALAYEGVLVRRPGSGTFVDGPPQTTASYTLVQMMSSDPYWSRVFSYVSDVWNTQYPARQITFQTNIVDHSDFYALLSRAVGSGTAPDVAMVDCVWVAGLAQAGFLYALEEVVSQWDRSMFGDDLYGTFVRANSFNDRQYGLPVKADVSLLWYRRDWFAREGLTPPQDWDDLLRVAGHFLKPEVQQRYELVYPLAFPGGLIAGEATVYNLMPLVWSAGGRVFDADTVVLDAPSTRRVLTFLRDLVNVHRISPPGVVIYKSDASPRLFAAGQVAMALGGSYESDILLEASGWSVEEFVERVGCVLPPAAPGSRAVSTVGGMSYVILRQCRQPALMMDVLRMATSPDVVGDMYRSMLQSLPRPSFNALLDPVSEPLLAQTSAMIASGRARPSISEYVKISRQLQTMFEAAISDVTPVETIARRTAEFIGAISERPCRSL